MTDRDDHKKIPASPEPDRDLAGVLHDVSNALTVLLGWVAEARTPDAAPETVGQALKIIEQRARIARDLARHAIGSPRLDEQLAAGAIVAEVIEALGVEATRAGVPLVARGAGGAAMVAGALDLSQVVTNLVLNALAHAPRGSELELELVDDEESCAIVVADQGPGVPASREASIFQGDSRRPGGTGIGLRHSRALARAWGGDVELEASATGAGARFRIRWPRVDGTHRPPVSTPRARELAGIRVLVVEDDEAVTQLLEAALEGRGAAVTIAATESELAAATGPFDAALIDLSPIALDPKGAIERLRAGSPGIDLVLITGSADRLPEAVSGENMKLVRKPFELSEIFLALKRG